MPSILWTGRLSPILKSLVNFSNLLAWITGNARDTASMKQRMKKGYDGSATADVTRYDELGLTHYTAIAKSLLEETALQGLSVQDIGCGTGILSMLALGHGATRVICADLSDYMLTQCKNKASALGYKPSQIIFRQLDAESLPFDNGTFDAVISGMVLGLMPNQKKALDEMVRVIKSGGTLSISTHGPDLYFEACEATFKAMPKSAVLGYRVEFWPRQEKQVSRMFSNAGLVDVRTRRLTWKEHFDDGRKAYEYFACTSSAWWYSKYTPDKVEILSQRVRAAFERRNITEITTDAVLAYGRKP